MHHFGVRGLFNGLAILGDLETNSLWDHITGECVHGSLQGERLEQGQLFHSTVKQILAAHPDASLAQSNQSFWQRLQARIIDWGRKRFKGFLPSFLKRTMGKEDERLPRMTMGLGVWTNTTKRYYTVDKIKEFSGFVIDNIDERRLLVYIEKSNQTPIALFTEAEGAQWQGEELRLSTGESLKEGVLRSAEGVEQSMDRPMQMFTRWYGFAYTFPGCEIY